MTVTATNLLLVASAAHTTQYVSASTACIVAQWLDISVNVTAFAGVPPNSPSNSPIVYVSYYRVEADSTQNLLVRFPVIGAPNNLPISAFKTIGIGSELNTDVGMNFVLKVDLA